MVFVPRVVYSIVCAVSYGVCAASFKVCAVTTVGHRNIQLKHSFGDAKGSLDYIEDLSKPF